MKNTWLELFVGLVALLLLGSYGYTYMAVDDVHDNLDQHLALMDQRLQRIEDYLLEILRNQK